MGWADTLGQISQVAAITSSGSAVASKVFNNTSSQALNSIGSMMGGAASLSNVAQNMAGLAYGAGNLASAANAFNAIGRAGDPLSKARLALSGISSLQNATSVAASFIDKMNGSGGAGGGGGGAAGGAGNGNGPAARGANIGNGGGSGGATGGPTGGGDWKVTLRVPAFGNSRVEFPVTPQVTITDAAKYSSAGLIHINYSMQFYESSETSSIQINGEFPIQNEAEGLKLLSAIHLLRACTKMFWGGDGLAGTPPPLMFLDGYGAKYLQGVPCVLTNFTHTMPEDKDYIPCNGTRVPTLSTIQCQLQPVYSRASLESLSIASIATGGSLQYL